MENSLSFLQDDHPDVAQHIRAEVEATQHVAELSRKLKEYETIFGPGLSSQSPDVQALAEELRKKESEIEKLHLLEQQREEVSETFARVCHNDSIHES